ncbi:hypothetical protein H5410_043247 [Solanum commersonii]|uniref:Secreted protein n=1 Tax=Solanum commersonii TaxID=4109 RepID=A0A9J5XXX3_SOLCO|nr:hypothetical protein H5410_043247 [Solanum commersonii]
MVWSIPISFFFFLFNFVSNWYDSSSPESYPFRVLNFLGFPHRFGALFSRNLFLYKLLSFTENKEEILRLESTPKRGGIVSVVLVFRFAAQNQKSFSSVKV